MKQKMPPSSRQISSEAGNRSSSPAGEFLTCDSGRGETKAQFRRTMRRTVTSAVSVNVEETIVEEVRTTVKP